MILYFTGTGNSRFVAKRLAELLSDEIYSINDALRSHETAHLNSEKPFVFVAPPYMSRLPMAVEDFISNGSFTGNLKTYFVFAAAQAVGKAGKYCERLCEKKGMIYMGTGTVKCPANYVVNYDVTPKKDARVEMEKAIPEITRLASVIECEMSMTLDSAFAGHKAFSALAPAITSLASAKKFNVSDACVSCKSCMKVCPLNNVQIRNDKPVWGREMHALHGLHFRLSESGDQLWKQDAEPKPILSG